MLVEGTKQYGKIARVPGVLYVSTQFVHFCFLPFFPTRSFVIHAGSETSDGFFGGTFQGKPIPLHLWSVLTGYARWWFGVPTVIMTFATWISASEFLIAAKVGPQLRFIGAWVLLGLLAVLLGLVALSMRVPGNRGYWFQAVIHLVSVVAGVVYWVMVEQQPHLAELRPAVNTPVPPLLIMNACLLVCGLFRPLDYADPDEARELAQKLGIDLPQTEGEDWELVE